MIQAINWYQFDFARIGPGYKIEVIERSLLPIGEAVYRCVETIEQAQEIGDAQYIDCVVDDETAIIENLLGTAFVICQSYITFVVSRVKSLHESCRRLGVTLTITDESKASIMRLGSRILPGTQYSQVQIIDAFANYFKHHEEWRGDWGRLPSPASETAQMIQSAGAQQLSTGNFRTASAQLGNRTYSDVQIFSGILQDWGQEVHRLCDLELRGRNL